MSVGDLGERGAAEVFEEYRRILLGLGYRLLGSMWDAEDVVQEAYLRWMNTDRSQIREPRSFLVTVVTRLALDQLRSARVTREAYTGPWLPEPVDGQAFGPMETAELRDTLSYATLHMMERLSPPERAVFVLREAFDVPYEQIAEILGSPVATCRQWHHRAAGYVTRGAGRFTPTSSDHSELLTRFLAAARDGDMNALTELLAEDAVAYNDGGGKVRAALRPIAGRGNLLAFVAGLMSRYPVQEARLTQANGEPAIWTEIGGQRQLVTFDVRDGRIHAIYAVLNPDKLTHISAQPSEVDRLDHGADDLLAGGDVGQRVGSVLAEADCARERDQPHGSEDVAGVGAGPPYPHGRRHLPSREQQASQLPGDIPITGITAGAQLLNPTMVGQKIGKHQSGGRR